MMPRSDHPSDFRLDALHLGELEETTATAVRAHLGECEPCTRRMAVRSAGAFPGLDVASMVSRLAGSALAAEAAPLPWWRRLAVPMTACVAAAAVLIVFAVRREEDLPGGETVQAKGSAVSLSVFSDDSAGAAERTSGDVFHSGDHIRFKVGLGASDSEHIVIVGVEASGKTSVYYPPTAERLARPPERSADGALVGAIELDDYVGREWLYLVACPTEFPASDVFVDTPGEPPNIPALCRWDSFLVVKE